MLVQIRREIIRFTDFNQHLKSGVEVVIPVRHIGRWGVIRGIVTEIHSFSDGYTVLLKTTPGSIMGWPIVPIWVSHNTGQAGVV
jgi:hypothetical protein